MRFESIPGQISSLALTKASSSTSRVSVPVQPSLTVYAQYRYVSGTPAASGQKTISLSRLQILNSLISTLQKRSEQSTEIPQLISKPENSEVLIQQYAAQLHSIINKTPVQLNALSGAATSGIVFQINT